jgi:hypothetical protein
MRIPSDVARKIGHYVYLYVDPCTRRPFYVGKGRGSRALAHLGMTKRSRKATILRDLRRAHRSPQIDDCKAQWSTSGASGLSSVSSLRAIPRQPISGGLSFGRTPERDAILGSHIGVVRAVRAMIDAASLIPDEGPARRHDAWGRCGDRRRERRRR